MKVVALEEHFATEQMLEAWRALRPDLQDIAVRQSTGSDVERRLFDLGPERIELMDKAGVQVQVLSLTTPGVQSLDASEAVSLARDTNDVIADTIRAHPNRFQGFATVATPNAIEAVRELDRAIRHLRLHGAMLCGRTRDRNLDDVEFLPIFEAASALNVPLYLHPQSPRTTVREAYYSGFGNQLDAMFATAGIGWHYEDGIQALRLVLAGIFDRYPNLQIILGHWGEVVLFFLERIDKMSALGKQVGRLQRPIIEYFQTNFSVTPSGIFSDRYLRWSIEVLGVDRILFSTDYPYLIDSAGVSRFFENATLTEEEKVKIAFSNWERMCSAIRR